MTDPDLTVSDTLAVLMSWIGERVEVAASGRDGAPPVMALHTTGTLGAGRELSSSTDDLGAPIFFSFEEDPGAGIVLDPHAFAGARTSGDELVVVLGEIELTITLSAS